MYAALFKILHIFYLSLRPSVELSGLEQQCNIWKCLWNSCMADSNWKKIFILQSSRHIPNMAQSRLQGNFWTYRMVSCRNIWNLLEGLLQNVPCKFWGTVIIKVWSGHMDVSKVMLDSIQTECFSKGIQSYTIAWAGRSLELESSASLIMRLNIFCLESYFAFSMKE